MTVTLGRGAHVGTRFRAATRSLAIEYASRSSRVNVVSPGSTDTEFIRSILTEDQLARRIKGNPLGRLATPDDVADAICFFLGDASSYITGQVLSVNGGVKSLSV